MRYLLIAVFTFAFFPRVWAQNVTLSGYVKDSANGESLIGVSVFTTEPRYGTVTNAYGFYSLTLPAGSYELNFSYLGFAEKRQKISIKKNTTINIEMREASQQLQEVVVSDKKLDENLRSPEMGVNELSTREIKKIPQFLGEVDIVRTLTLLPGVSTVGEGANGFNVRGGNVDQNLILIDQAPVFNSSHLFGFFSIFNGDAVKDVKLYKGGMPAYYGGRLSSVLDVRQKEGNSKNFAAEGGVGLLSARLLLEGPIVKDKLTYMVAGRRSYMDIFTPLATDPEVRDAKAYFYDFNAKLNYHINDKHKLFLSGYYGKDVFGASELFDFGWGNGTTTLRWNYLINPKLFMNTTLVYSDYKYLLQTPQNSDFDDFKWESRIRNYNGKLAFTFYPNVQHKIDFGAEAVYYTFDPGVISGAIETELQQVFALEPSIYLQDEWNVTEKLTVLAGLRFTTFYNMGNREVYSYTDGQPLEDEFITDTTQFSKGDVIESFTDFGGLEPRISLNYRVNKNVSLKASYNRNRQYIHLISNRTTPTPVDIWRPAGEYIKPATVNQVAIGYFQNFKEGKYALSTEVFYKKYENLVDYKNGADLIFKDNIETELLSGQGRAYGLELMIEKQVGKLTGWVSYTLSRSELQVDKGPTPREWINDGEWYAANYDKTHDITVVAAYELNEKWSLSANFAFQTGRPITPPESRGVFTGVYYPVNLERNGMRIPSYHRLDISATMQLKTKPGKKWNHNLNFGVYNVYARKNAYSIYFTQDTDTGLTQAMRLSIFATAIPSVTYNFNF